MTPVYPFHSLDRVLSVPVVKMLISNRRGKGQKFGEGGSNRPDRDRGNVQSILMTPGFEFSPN